MIEFVKRRRLKIVLKMMMISLAILIINLIVRRNDRILFYEHWTPIDSMVIFGMIFFILVCVYVFIKWENIMFRIALVFGFLVITGYVSMMALISGNPYEIYRNEGYTIYVSQWRFIFAGEDSFYLKENILTSVYIGSGDQSEEWNTTYYIEDDIFYIIETSETGTIETTTIVLRD